jgi:hypothetical protein
MRFAVIIILQALLVPFALTQDPGRTDPDEVIGQILDEALDEQDLLHYSEDLEYLKQHPVNIATAHYGDLLQIPFFSPMLATQLLLLRDTVMLTSTGQLMGLSAMTPELFERISPFIIAEQPSTGKQAFDGIPNLFVTRSRVERRLRPQIGESTGKFLGDRNTAYQRIRIGNDRFEAAGLFEKDAGEAYDNGFFAGFLALRSIGVLRRMVFGTFTVASGQGLLFAKNIAPAKGINTVGQTKLRSAGISPSVSTDESRYFRGIAAEMKMDRISVSGFHSQRLLHASIDSAGSVTSLFTSGSFRTANDIRKKERLGENVTGGILEYTVAGTTTLSLNLVHLSYDHFLLPSLYDLSGKRYLTAGSGNVRTTLVNNELFAEFASNDGTGFSKVIGMLFPVSRLFSVNMHHRSFAKGYVNPLARPFGERSNISDGETGNYFGIQIRIGKVMLHSYADEYSLPSTTTQFGATGHELLAHGSFPVTKRLILTAQIKNKRRNQTNIHGADDERSQTNMRVGISYAIDAQWNLTQRYETVSVKYRPSDYRESGFLSFLELRYLSRRAGVNVRSRIVLFGTGSYDTRLYQYESDVAGNFSNPPLYGKGIRWYVVSGWKVTDALQLSFKYAETKRLGTSVIGSGDDAIPGALDSALALQVDFKL